MDMFIINYISYITYMVIKYKEHRLYKKSYIYDLSYILILSIKINNIFNTKYISNLSILLEILSISPNKYKEHRLYKKSYIYDLSYILILSIKINNILILSISSIYLYYYQLHSIIVK